MKIIMPIIIVFFFLISCSEDTFRTIVNPKKLGQIAEPKIVVLGIISPTDSIIRIQVSQSIPVLSNLPSDTLFYLKDNDTLFFVNSNTYFLPIKNASVTISDGVKTKKLNYDKIQTTYNSLNDGFLVPGKKYLLNVTANNQTVTSECTIPVYKPTIVSFEIDTLKNNTSNQNNSYYTVNSKVKWADNPNEVNYYYVGLNLSFKAKVIINQMEVLQESNLLYPLYPESGNFLYQDLLQNNNIITSKIYTASFGGENDIFQNIKEVKLDAQVITSDEHLYAYLTSQQLQDKNNGNPFVEAVQIYSNINGGLGCFSGINPTTKIFNLKN